MILPNPPRSIPQTGPQIERPRESLTGAISAPACTASVPISIRNAPVATSPVVSFNIDNAAQSHLQQLREEIDQKMNAVERREANIRNHDYERRERMEANITAVSKSIEQFMADQGTGHIAGKY